MLLSGLVAKIPGPAILWRMKTPASLFGINGKENILKLMKGLGHAGYKHVRDQTFLFQCDQDLRVTTGRKQRQEGACLRHAIYGHRTCAVLHAGKIVHRLMLTKDQAAVPVSQLFFPSPKVGASLPATI